MINNENTYNCMLNDIQYKLPVNILTLSLSLCYFLYLNTVHPVKIIKMNNSILDIFSFSMVFGYPFFQFRFCICMQHRMCIACVHIPSVAHSPIRINRYLISFKFRFIHIFFILSKAFSFRHNRDVLLLQRPMSHAHSGKWKL